MTLFGTRLPYSDAVYRIYREKLAEVAGKSVLMCHPNMVKDLEEVGCPEGGCAVYSVLPTYIANEPIRQFDERVKARGFRAAFLAG